MAAEPIQVTIDEPDDSVRVDDATGTIEIDQPDGGVVVKLDVPHKKKDDGKDDWFDNLADDLDLGQMSLVSNDLIDAIQADDTSRQGYLAIRTRGIGMLGIELKEPRATATDGGSIEGMSTVTNPLLLDALLKGWANAQAEFLPANGPVKIKDDGDETAVQDDLAESFERDLNHWFTTTAAEYYPETSHMLLWGTYLGGSGFKKTYRCPMRRRPVSESVPVEDLIVSDTTKDLRACSRITHQIKMRPSVMKRMKFIKAYRDVTLTQPTPTTNAVDAKIQAVQGTQSNSYRPEDQPYTIWESQCELDLDQFIPDDSQFKGEGIPLPYVVTIDKDSREILALRRDWDEDDPECERRRMYVKYPYVPGPGFYGTGLINILGNASAALTAAWREALDAGMFASFPGGVIAKLGGRQNTSQIRCAPGEFVPIETNGMPISQIITGLPYKDVTPGLMALIDKITEQAKSVGGAVEIPVAEGIQNVPVGTMLAAVEQATKIIAAAHKGMHQAQSEEIQLIVNLFRENPEDFWRGNKVCPSDYWNEEKFLAALDECQNRLTPVSDPNVPSHIHRVSKALALINLLPLFPGMLDPKEVLKRCLSAIKEDPRGLIVDPPPTQQQPSAVDIAKLTEANAKSLSAQTGAKKLEFDTANAQRKDAVTLAQTASKERIAQTDLQREVIIHAHDGERVARQDALAAQAQQHDQFDSARGHALEQQQHGLEVEKHQHAVNKDVAEHALNVHTALNPPKPAQPKAKK